MARIIEQVTGRPAALPSQGGAKTEDQLAEEFDRSYTNAVLDKLDDAVKRASDFDPIAVKADNPAVQEYFKEAHDLYLFGFRIGLLAARLAALSAAGRAVDASK